MKNRSEFKHGFTNRSYLHGAILKALHDFQKKRAHKSRGMQFFLIQNDFLQNDLKTFRMFKNNMRFTRAACWINLKISNRDINITLITFLCHYYWSFLWCNYWKSLKLGCHLQKKLHYLRQWKAFKSDGRCFLFHLKNSPRSQNI